MDNKGIKGATLSFSGEFEVSAIFNVAFETEFLLIKFMAPFKSKT